MIALLILFFAGVLSLFLGLFEKRSWIQPMALTATAAALLVNLGQLEGQFISNLNTKYSSMLHFDQFALSFGAVVLCSALLIFGLMSFAFRDLRATLGDNIGLMMFSLCGALCLFAYTNAVMLFLAIEILSIPLYVLAGSRRNKIDGNEAALKYFLQGAFATGILLFGLTLVYGSTASFDINKISEAISAQQGSISTMLKVGIMMIMAGLSFKVAAAPFHFWSPDVYEGSPNLVTTFMATVVKTASFAAFFKLFSIAFAPAASVWIPALTVLAALSMILANFVAIFQQSFKRMMAYSSISHTGYMLLAILAFDQAGATSALLFYALAYSIATICAFAIFILVSEQQGNDRLFSAFNGLAKSRPYLALVMVVCMISLAGIPPTAGFFGKYFLFAAAFSKFPVLVIVAILNSAVSIYYYFRVLQAMYFKTDSLGAVVDVPVGYRIVMGLGMALIILLCLVPSLVYGQF